MPIGMMQADSDLIRQIPKQQDMAAASTKDLIGHKVSSVDRFTALSAANNGGRPTSNNHRPPTSGG